MATINGVLPSKAIRLAAAKAFNAGISVVPPAEDQTKRPDSRWKEFQKRLPSREEMRAWYGVRHGLGFVCGAVSGGLELFEFDDRATYEAFKEAAEAGGLGDLVERIEAGYLEETPGDGIHWFYRTDEVRGNTKLAERPDPTDPNKRQPLIETRGEGGYAVVAPSGGPVHPSGNSYILLRGDVDTIVTIGGEERDQLWDLARTFDEMPATGPVVGSKPNRAAGDKAADGTLSPGDDYAARTSWTDILPAGWVHVHTHGETELWRRPDKAKGWSATINHGGSDCLYVFSSSTAFKPLTSYTKFGAYAQLHHCGDFHEAAKALCMAGYGTYEDTEIVDGKLRREIRQNPRSKGGGTKAKRAASANGNGDGTAHVTIEHGDDEPEGDEEDEVLDRWPKPQPLAFHGLAGDIVRAIAPHTEADPVAILVQLLVAFANMIGRRAYSTVGATRHFLNLYAALVGPTASGRKGSAWDMVSWVLSQFDPDWAARRVQGGLVSGEGLIYHVRDAAYETRESKAKDGAIRREQVMVDAGVDDKRLLVLETEMGRVLKAMSRESNTLSDVLRQGWDRNVLAAMGKNKGCIATAAHISVIGHVTRPDIVKHLTREDSSNGFANRFLWIAVRRSKELPDGGDLYSDDFAREWEPIKHRLEQTVAQAREIDRMQRDVDAGRMWRGIYGELTGGKPGLLGAVLNRAEAQVMRLSCVYALLDQSSYVHPEHLVAALALWNYCEDSARYTFGDAFASPAAEKLLAALKEAPEGLTRTHISSVVFAKNKGKAEIDSLLSEMLTDGMIHRTKVKPERGRPTELWRAGRGGDEHATD